ncbi:hypothetical protein Trydic_g14284 [Trypoxylus dichotomus]
MATGPRKAATRAASRCCDVQLRSGPDQDATASPCYVTALTEYITPHRVRRFYDDHSTKKNKRLTSFPRNEKEKVGKREREIDIEMCERHFETLPRIMNLAEY